MNAKSVPKAEAKKLRAERYSIAEIFAAIHEANVKENPPAAAYDVEMQAEYFLHVLRKGRTRGKRK